MTADRYQGSLFGLAIGDALGTTPDHVWTDTTHSSEQIMHYRLGVRRE